MMVNYYSIVVIYFITLFNFAFVSFHHADLLFLSLGNKFLDWLWLIGGGLTRGFTQFDMNSLSVSVSIFDCVLISFVLETDMEIDR